MAESIKSKGMYYLTIDLQNILANVYKDLVDAKIYLESADIDNTMECYGDFMGLYKELHRTIYKVDAIMSVHNMSEGAMRLAKDLENFNK